jgi:hypothetical protein
VGFGLYAVAALHAFDSLLEVRADLEKLSHQLERRLVVFGLQRAGG